MRILLTVLLFWASPALALSGIWGNDSGCLIALQGRDAASGLQGDMLILDGRSIRWIESGCALSDDPTGDGTPILASCDGEEDEWMIAVSISRSDNALIYRDSDGTSVTLHRCE